MTIDGFNDYIKKKNSKCITKIPLNLFKGKTFSFDIYGLIFMMRSGAIKSVDTLFNIENGDVNYSEIDKKCTELIISKLCVYLNHNINLILCFDSKHHSLRSIVREKRSNSKSTLRNKFKELKEKLKNTDPLFRPSILNEMKKTYTLMYDVPDYYITNLKTLLKDIGFCVLTPAEFYNGKTGDGEALCATLCMNQISYAAVTSDGDYHLYGGTYSILSLEEEYILENGLRKKEWYVNFRNINIFLEEEGISFYQFQQISILAGVDYNFGVKGISFTTAIKHIKKYGTLEKFLIENESECLKKNKDPINEDDINYSVVKELIDSAIVVIPKIDYDFNIEKFIQQAKTVLLKESLLNSYSLLSNTTLIQNMMISLSR